MLNEVNWPQDYLPSTTDNFASNEIIVKGITAQDVFENLIDTSVWQSYYNNVADIYFYDGDAPKLKANTRFKFSTFGFPIEAQVVEFEAPADGKPGRLAWHGWAEGDADHHLDVIHPKCAEKSPNLFVGRKGALLSCIIFLSMLDFQCRENGCSFG